MRNIISIILTARRENFVLPVNNGLARIVRLAQFDAFAKSVQEGKEEAEAHGAVFVYPDVSAFREKCMPLLESIANQSEMTKTIYDKVEALRKGE